MRSIKIRVTTCVGLALALLLSALTFGSVQQASALPYPVNSCSPLSVSTSAPHPGQAIQVSGTGFHAGSTVTLVLHSPAVKVGTAKVAKNGTFTTSISIPKDLAPGRHLLYVDGGHPGCPVDPAVLRVAGTPGSPSGGPSHHLAVTGSDVLAGLLIALGLIGVGLLLNQRGRRRHHSGHAA